MRTIHFKNGKTKKVDQRIIDSLLIRVVHMGGAGELQFYCREGDEKSPHLVINILEINYID